MAAPDAPNELAHRWSMLMPLGFGGDLSDKVSESPRIGPHRPNQRGLPVSSLVLGQGALRGTAGIESDTKTAL
ncbi:MAG: hypothetical protein WCC21_12970 [Candidatus Acidiferrales bacterium]